MERRDKFILLLLLAGGGLYAHRHWDEIATRLSLDDLRPGRIKAMELAKKEYTFERVRTNDVVVQQRVSAGEIKAVGDLWTADPQGGDRYFVNCTWVEGRDRCTQVFEVDIGSGRVVARDLDVRAN
jgi:hypothetical protein